MKEKKRDIIFLRWLPLLLICVYVVFPIYWAINTALKTEPEILGKTITYLPKDLTWIHLLWHGQTWDLTNISSIVESKWNFRYLYRYYFDYGRICIESL